MRGACVKGPAGAGPPRRRRCPGRGAVNAKLPRWARAGPAAVCADDCVGDCAGERARDCACERVAVGPRWELAEIPLWYLLGAGAAPYASCDRGCASGCANDGTDDGANDGANDCASDCASGCANDCRFIAAPLRGLAGFGT